MKNDIKLPFVLSLSLHLSLFIILSLQFKKSNYIVLPVDLAFYGHPPAVSEPGVKSVKEKIIQKLKEVVKKDKGEISVSKKKASEEKVEEKSAPAPAQSSAPNTMTGSRSQISLDTANFPYAYYTSTIVKKIERNWQWSTAFGQIRALVYFRIRRDGTISELKIKETSGDATFDQQVLRSVAISGPFPPLPDGYTENDLGVYFEFAFRE